MIYIVSLEKQEKEFIFYFFTAFFIALFTIKKYHLSLKKVKNKRWNKLNISLIF